MNTQLILKTLNELSKKTVPILIQKGITISTAESCTGGMLSEAITSVAGASNIFEIGISAYTNRIKHEALSVPMSVLHENGAISVKTAMYMAKNILALSGSKIGIGITGNAGPSADENKPIGLVYIAIADEATYFVKKIQYPKTADRETIRLSASINALELIEKYASASPALLGRMVPYGEDLFIDEQSLDCDLALFMPQSEPLKELTVNVLADEDFLAEGEEDTLSNVNPKIKFKKAFTKFLSAFKNFDCKKYFDKIKKFLTPKKKPNPKTLIKTGIFAVCIIGLISSSLAIASHFINESQQRNVVSSAREQWNYSDQKKEETGVLRSFDTLRAQNSDIMGWITIDNTNIDNPIYQAKDNDYYVSHNMLKEKNRYGALFFDYKNKITKNESSQNLTIYGHNMKDGSMFGSLQKYRKLDFYKANPTFSLTTLYGKEEYRIFSVMVMNASAADDNDYIYNFVACDFPDQQAFVKWSNEAKERSLINTTVDVDERDEVLTLVTCSEDFNNSRFVVMARKTRKGETNSVDVSNAKLNPNPRYPQAWYDKKGLDGYTMN